MPWYCLGCGRRMGSPVCKKSCRLQWGEAGAERIPPLDGFARLEVDPAMPEEDDLAAREIWFAVKRKKDENAGSAERPVWEDSRLGRRRRVNGNSHSSRDNGNSVSDRKESDMRDMIGRILFQILFQKSVVLVGLIATGVVALVAAVFAVEGLIIWALWNALVPPLAGGPSVTYVQGVLMGVALSVVGAALGRR